MRAWYKYWLGEIGTHDQDLSIDQNFAEHAKTIGGFAPDAFYETKESFFQHYLWEYHEGRLAAYNQFLKKRLSKDAAVLSVASGRCANELLLSEKGYPITCSDLERFAAHDQTQKLFPSFQWISYNVLEGPHAPPVDAVICLSTIYLFNDQQLDDFFKNISESLTPGGHLLLDSAGSPDNFLSWLIHDIVLRYETRFKKWLSLLMGSERGVIRKFHGYRRTDKDIFDVAQRHGFQLMYLEKTAFLTEFKRSSIVGRVINGIPCSTFLFSKLGKSIPYIRLFDFQKRSTPIPKKV